MKLAVFRGNKFDRRAGKPALLPPRSFPSDPIDTVLERNDVAVLLRSDLRPNIDDALTKRFNITERMKIQLGGQFYNLFNHSQFIPGLLSDLTSESFVGAGRNFLIPGNAAFGQYSQFFPSNSRQVQVVAKFTF